MFVSGLAHDQLADFHKLAIDVDLGFEVLASANFDQVHGVGGRYRTNYTPPVANLE